MAPSADDALPCIPPHPARGSDTHRIVAFVLEHANPLALEALILAHEIPPAASAYKLRVTDMRRVLAGGTEDGGDVRLMGYQFYRTCWTRAVSQFYPQIGTAAALRPH